VDGTVTLNFTLEASGRSKSLMFSQTVAQLNVIHNVLNYMSFTCYMCIEKREVLIHNKY